LEIFTWPSLVELVLTCRTTKFVFASYSKMKLWMKQP